MMGETRRAPTSLGDMNKHYWLSLSMARATGVDLVAAVKAGDLTQTEWSEMVGDCRACDWSAGCQRWLSRPRTGFRAVPEGCVNARRLEALRDLQAEDETPRNSSRA